jgi:RNA polymerase sigma-70 factor (ECF subfamily)
MGTTTRHLISAGLNPLAPHQGQIPQPLTGEIPMSDDAAHVRQLGMEPMESTAAQHTRQHENLGHAAVIDRAEFGELYLRYRDPVFRYVRRLCGSEDEAADLTALTFERALARLQSYRADGAGFAPWLFRIARNQAWDARRRKRPWLPLQLLALARHPQEGSTPEEAALRRESIGELSRYLDELPEIQRECLLLRYAGGLTAREIGAVIGKSDEATQKLLTRAIAKLKENYRG